MKGGTHQILEWLLEMPVEIKPVPGIHIGKHRHPSIKNDKLLKLAHLVSLF